MPEESRRPSPSKNNQNIPTPDDGSKSFEQLSIRSVDLKTRIEEARRRYDLPLDSSLGDPKWEQSAADGHLNIPEKEND
jgi:hypothetical protein